MGDEPSETELPMDYQRLVEAARRNVKEVSPEETREALDRGEVDVLLDVREPNEWSRGHLPGALHVPLGKLSFEADPRSPGANPELIGRKGSRIVAYCARGNRSVLAADALKKLGYGEVASMKGGIVDWSKHGYPVE